MGEKDKGLPLGQEIEVWGTSYDDYLRLGGIINERDYISALERAERVREVGPYQAAQVRQMGEVVGTPFDEQVVRLYGVLRTDQKPPGVQHHHSQMTDQGLLWQVLEMLNRQYEIVGMFMAYPNILLD